MSDWVFEGCRPISFGDRFLFDDGTIESVEGVGLDEFEVVVRRPAAANWCR